MPTCRTCRKRGQVCVYQEPNQQKYASRPTIRGSTVVASLIFSRSPDFDLLKAYLQRLERIEDVLRQHSGAINSLPSLPASSPQPFPPTLMNDVPEISSGPCTHDSCQRDGSPLRSTILQTHSMDDSLRHADHSVPALTIPLEHQTSTSSLLTLPEMSALVGDFPEEFLFLVEENRPRPASLDDITTESQKTGRQSLVIERHLTDRYLEQYLTRVHPFRPLFDQEILTSQYERLPSQGLEHNLQSALFLAIFALGAVVLDPIDPTRTAYSGDQMIKTAIQILLPCWAMTFRGDLVLSQALVLCALYFCHILEPLVAWRFVYMASTNIQQMFVLVIPDH